MRSRTVRTGRLRSSWLLLRKESFALLADPRLCDRPPGSCCSARWTCWPAVCASDLPVLHNSRPARFPGGQPADDWAVSEVPELNRDDEEARGIEPLGFFVARAANVSRGCTPAAMNKERAGVLERSAFKTCAVQNSKFNLRMGLARLRFALILRSRSKMQKSPVWGGANCISVENSRGIRETGRSTFAPACLV
jgi:hypothetical protein